MLSHFSCDWLFETLWTGACQAPLSIRFYRQEYWSGLPFPSPKDLPDPGIKPTSLMSPALTGRFFYHQRHLGSPLALIYSSKFLYLNIVPSSPSSFPPVFPLSFPLPPSFFSHCWKIQNVKFITYHYCDIMCLVAQLCLTLFDPMDCSPPDSSVHGNSPGKNTGMGCHACLQGIFPIQGSNPVLPQICK